MPLSTQGVSQAVGRLGKGYPALAWANFSRSLSRVTASWNLYVCVTLDSSNNLSHQLRQSHSFTFSRSDLRAGVFLCKVYCRELLHLSSVSAGGIVQPESEASHTVGRFGEPAQRRDCLANHAVERHSRACSVRDAFVTHTPL